MKPVAVFLCFILVKNGLFAQATKQAISLEDASGLQATNVTIQPDLFKGTRSVKVVDDAKNGGTELRIAKLTGSAFHNGTIEVELAGEPMKNSSEDARGFVGIAFRINNTDTKFEAIYLRPTNGRADDQVRRNHTVQYISYPDFPWYKLRKDFPGKYETYVDLEVGAWTSIRIEIMADTARLFVHGGTQPTLIVTDLKHGPDLTGSIGLWIGPGTEAHFRNLVVTKYD